MAISREMFESSGEKKTMKLTPLSEGATFNLCYKCKRKFVNINFFPCFLISFSSLLIFLLHQLFALSDLPAEWFFKWLFERLLIHRLITNYSSYYSFVSFLNEIPQPKQEKWQKTWNWTLMSWIPLCFLFMNCIPYWTHLYCSFM